MRKGDLYNEFMIFLFLGFGFFSLELCGKLVFNEMEEMNELSCMIVLLISA